MGVKLQSSSGGSVEIAAPVTASNYVLTAPAGNGTVDYLQRAGNVLQVVQGTTSVQTSTTSTSYVATSLSATITPTSNTSKIYCAVHTTTWFNIVVDDYVYLTLYRNGTNIGGGSGGCFTLNSGAHNPVYDTAAAFHYIDSPYTTSALTYTLYIKAAYGNSIAVNDSACTNVITLMEIAG